jgi:hypothetical protein
MVDSVMLVALQMNTTFPSFIDLRSGQMQLVYHHVVGMAQENLVLSRGCYGSEERVLKPLNVEWSAVKLQHISQRCQYPQHAPREHIAEIVCSTRRADQYRMPSCQIYIFYRGAYANIRQVSCAGLGTELA